MKNLWRISWVIPLLLWSVSTLAANTASPSQAITPNTNSSSAAPTDENNILSYNGKILQNLLDKLPGEMADSILIRFKVKGLVDQVPGFDQLTNNQIGQLTISAITQSEDISTSNDVLNKSDDNKTIVPAGNKAFVGSVCVKDLFPSPLNNKEQSIDYWQPFTVCVKTPTVTVEKNNETLANPETSPSL